MNSELIINLKHNHQKWLLQLEEQQQNNQQGAQPKPGSSNCTGLDPRMATPPVKGGTTQKPAPLLSDSKKSPRAIRNDGNSMSGQNDDEELPLQKRNRPAENIKKLK